MGGEKKLKILNNLKIFNLGIIFLFLSFLSVNLGYKQSWASSEKEDLARLAEEARKEGKMVFYTSVNVDNSTVLLKKFRERYPFLQTELYRATGEKLVTKIIMEARANKHSWDATLSNGFDIHVLKKEGLLMKYVPPESEVYLEGFKDPDGYWTDASNNTFIFGYNTNLVSKKEAPKTYEDLLEPKWKGKIGMDDREYEWFANMLKIMGRAKGIEYMKKFASQNLHFRSGHTLLTELVIAGEIPLAIMYGHRVEQMKRKGAPIEWVGLEPVVTSLNSIAVAAYTPRPNAAKLFINFVLSKEGQEVIKSFPRIPARPDVFPDPPGLVKGLKLFPGNPALAEDIVQIEKEFREIFFKKK